MYKIYLREGHKLSLVGKTKNLKIAQIIQRYYGNAFIDGRGEHIV
jgi:hypothetical protein